jgi:hypothetical protein
VNPLRVAAAVPAALAGVASLALVAMALAGASPVWAVRPQTLPEAAALRDPADVARRIAAGENPYAPGVVRDGVVADTDKDLSLNALEAAIGSRRSEVVQLILFAAPPRDTAVWERATCLAALVGDRDVTAALDAARPASIVAQCQGFRRPW